MPSDSWMPNSIEKYATGPGICGAFCANQRVRLR